MTRLLYWYYNMCLDCLGSIRTRLMCQKPVALCYWYGAWRREAIDNQLSGSGQWTRWHLEWAPPGGSGVAAALEAVRRLAAVLVLLGGRSVTKALEGA